MGKIKYNDFEQMFGDMKTYVKNSGHTLVAKEDLKELQIGFIDSVNDDTWFVMDINMLGNWVDKTRAKIYNESNFDGNNRCKLILKCLETHEGQDMLAEIINKVGE